jgi:hypothetical protein
MRGTSSWRLTACWREKRRVGGSQALYGGWPLRGSAMSVHHEGGPQPLLLVTDLRVVVRGKTFGDG